MKTGEIESFKMQEFTAEEAGWIYVSFGICFSENEICFTV